MYVIQKIASGRILAHLRVLKEKPSEVIDFRGFVVAGIGLSKRAKWLIINYRYVSTFGVFEHFISKYLYCMPLFIMYSMCHIKYRFFVSTMNTKSTKYIVVEFLTRGVL